MVDQPSSHRIVDAHIHVWTDDFARYPLSPRVKEEDLWHPTFTPEEYFSYSRTVCDVRINLVQMIWYDYDHSYILDLIAGDEVEDIAMVVVVPDHLDQVDAHVADRTAVAEVLLGREGGVPEVLFLDPGG